MSSGSPAPNDLTKRNFKGDLYIPAGNTELQAKSDNLDFPEGYPINTSGQLVIEDKKYSFIVEHVRGRIIKLNYKALGDASQQEYSVINFDNLKNRLKLVPNFSFSSDGKINEDW